MSGRQPPGFLGGIHVRTFFPMQFLGAQGMPRRYPDHPVASQHGHYVARVGSYVAGLSFLILLVLVARTLLPNRRVGDDPWRGDHPRVAGLLASPLPHPREAAGHPPKPGKEPGDTSPGHHALAGTPSTGAAGDWPRTKR